MDRAERTGLGIALVGHALLFGALSVSLMRPIPKLPPLNPPIDVALVDAKALTTAAPDAVREASAPPEESAAPAAVAPAPPTPVTAAPSCGGRVEPAEVTVAAEMPAVSPMAGKPTERVRVPGG